MSFGKILGVNLKVHYLFLLWMIVAATLGEFYSALIIVFSVIFHELGHVLAAVNLGVEVREVELMPFGGVARVNRLLGSDPATETAIALAGPANSLV
ncbi:MAG: M50 family metallopeptidase, partial [Peptococcaceae bacterium]|nr:M50 family metallopeptidase [Peptococcaceae bacterium]